MFRKLDILLILVMTAAATVTYSIKHLADLKSEEVQRLEADIRLQHETIELLKADWALMRQPNRLQHLVDVFKNDLQLHPTDPSRLAKPVELPMLKADVPKPEKDDSKKGVASAQPSGKGKTDSLSTGSVKH
jgi:hypothetical protein